MILSAPDSRSCSAQGSRFYSAQGLMFYSAQGSRFYSAQCSMIYSAQGSTVYSAQGSISCFDHANEPTPKVKLIKFVEDLNIQKTKILQVCTW